MKKRVAVLLILFVFGSLLSSCAEPLGSPKKPVRTSDLAGTWVAHYGEGKEDRIILQDNGTFRQAYHDPKHDYYFETPWNQWELESVADHVVRVHLYGARYYLAGRDVAERNGRKDPKNPCLTPTDCSWGLEPFEFYDPYTDEFVQMVDRLVLDVRVDASGNLLLHHLWTSSDGGFALIGGNEEIFYRAP